MKASEIVLVILLLVCAVSGPLLIIWAVNTLFATSIEYSILNWLAVAILMSIIPATFSSNSK